jgi:membrane protein DedA with SNARE-associated domain
MIGVLVSLALLTLVSEDLACASAGLLVARGEIGFAAGTLACFLGIFFGDLGLYALGRGLGWVALERAPLRWFISRRSAERAAVWFRSSGKKVLFATRFLPGSRLPTYLAAGLVRCPLGVFAGALALAGALWTPAVVALAAWGGRLLGPGHETSVVVALGVLFAGLWLLTHLVASLVSWKGRRLLVSRWRRSTRWEFWPAWLFNIPVVLHWLWLGVRHRSLTLFTAANPGIATGGFVLESKSEILAAFGGDPRIARFRLIEAKTTFDERLLLVHRFMAHEGLTFPVVLKPDIGLRGRGVEIVRDEAALHAALGRVSVDTIVQEHVPGEEFGVFYARFPESASGRILSVNGKVFPVVVGDGRRTLEELILADERAVCQARLHLENQRDQLARVLPAGEELQLVDVGNHCRGTMFTDCRESATPALLAALDDLSRLNPGFFFGRYDLRAPSRAALERGEGLRILELNGVAAEVAHVYQPGSSILAAYRAFFEQWRVAYAIGAAAVRGGARPTPLRELVRLVGRHFSGGAMRAGDPPRREAERSRA